jgi:hypothetical protein
MRESATCPLQLVGNCFERPAVPVPLHLLRWAGFHFPLLYSPSSSSVLLTDRYRWAMRWIRTEDHGRMRHRIF